MYNNNMYLLIWWWPDLVLVQWRAYEQKEGPDYQGSVSRLEQLTHYAPSQLLMILQHQTGSQNTSLNQLGNQVYAHSRVNTLQESTCTVLDKNKTSTSFFPGALIT